MLYLNQMREGVKSIVLKKDYIEQFKTTLLKPLG